MKETYHDHSQAEGRMERLREEFQMMMVALQDETETLHVSNELAIFYLRRLHFMSMSPDKYNNFVTWTNLKGQEMLRFSCHKVCKFSYPSVYPAESYATNIQTLDVVVTCTRVDDNQHTILAFEPAACRSFFHFIFSDADTLFTDIMHLPTLQDCATYQSSG